MLREQCARKDGVGIPHEQVFYVTRGTEGRAYFRAEQILRPEARGRQDVPEAGEQTIQAQSGRFHGRTWDNIIPDRTSMARQMRMAELKWTSSPPEYIEIRH